MALRVAFNRVSIKKLQPQMLFGHIAVVDAFSGVGYDCFVTSGDDGVHKRQSLHERGLALDYRTKHIPRAAMTQLYRDIKRNLDPMFDVLWEDVNGPNEHLHVEYDPD